MNLDELIKKLEEIRRENDGKMRVQSVSRDFLYNDVDHVEIEGGIVLLI